MSTPAAATPFDTGAVAFIDALGFKGIWQRHDVSRVMDKLRAALKTASLQPRQDDSFRLSITFLTDTVIVAVAINPASRAPASDEAAEAERRAASYHGFSAALSIPAYRYPVPMKGPVGTFFQTMALVPSTTESTRGEVAERYTRAFGSNPQEASKLENTIAFVREAVDPTSSR